jgi:hypothetical protein
MNDRNIKNVLRADGIFNGLAGLVLQFYIRPALEWIGWVDTTDGVIYAMVLGSALIGLSLAVWLASAHPQQSRGTILASAVAKGLAGVTILTHLFILGTDIPRPGLLLGAVGVQVLFVLGEAIYLLQSRHDQVQAAALRS